MKGSVTIMYVLFVTTDQVHEKLIILKVVIKLAFYNKFKVAFYNKFILLLYLIL